MTIRRFLMIAVFLVGLPLLIDGAALAQAPSQATNWQQRFRTYDVDKNGCVDQREFQQWMTEAFYFRDKDRKGYLTADDLRGVMAPQTLATLTGSTGGKLTLPEFLAAAAKDFAAADVNKNGCLTMQEIEAYTHLAGK